MHWLKTHRGWQKTPPLSPLRDPGVPVASAAWASEFHRSLSREQGCILNIRLGLLWTKGNPRAGSYELQTSSGIPGSLDARALDKIQLQSSED